MTDQRPPGRRRAVAATTAVVTAAGLLGSGLASPVAAAPHLTTFEVTIANVSVEGQLDTDRADGMIPLSPGAYAVHNGSGVLFGDGRPASAGLELVAEDGAAQTLIDELAAQHRVAGAGLLDGDGDGIGPIVSGQTGTFTVTARRGQRLSFATMFVQSNDFFFADDGSGIALFAGGQPISGDITDQIQLWDAGTELDTAPGTGDDQVLAQGPGTDIGPAEGGVVTLVADKDFDFAVPAVEEVIRVTITPVA